MAGIMSPADDLQTLCSRVLMRNGSAPAIEFDGRWFSWGDLQRIAQKIALALNESGADPLAPVAFIARSRPSAIAALIALLAAGRTVRMIYAFQSPTAIARDIVKLKPAVVLCALSDMSSEVRAALSALGAAAISVDDGHTLALPGFEHIGQGAVFETCNEPRIEILTSGTTGPPKQFSVTYEMLGEHIVRAREALAEPEAAADNVPPTLLYFPLGNISGLYTTLPALLRGRRAVLLDRFSIEGWRDYVVRFRPEHTGIPPASMQVMLDADIPASDLTSVKTMGLGAAPLDPAVQRAFEARYGIPILLSYGATEFGGPVAMMTAELHAAFGATKFGSIGRPFGGAKIRVVDAVTRAPLPANQEGLLEVVSPRIGSDWIRTSDIGLIDEDGFLFHLGRADGAIVRGGFKILPEMIERVLLEHSAVSAAAVVGIASRRLGQVPGAAIQVSLNSDQPSVTGLEAHVREHLPATYIPVMWRFVNELPKTPLMKIDRPAVLRLFADEDAQKGA